MTSRWPNASEIMTFAEVRRRFRNALRRGESRTCPCCARYAKVYRYKLSRNLGVTVCWMLTRGWVDIAERNARFKLRFGFALASHTHKLRYWGLLESHADGRRYRLTRKGVRFAQGAVKVLQSVLLFDEKLMGREGPRVGIREVLNGDDDYAALTERGA